MSITKHFSTINFRDYDELISLGTCCHPTFFIRDHQLSKDRKSYPFDWIATDSIESIIDALTQSFHEFSQTITRKLTPTYNYDALTTEHYRFVIPHHTKSAFETQTKKKIQSFFDLFSQESNKKVLFLLECHPINRCTPENANKLIQILKQLGPTLTITLLIVNEYKQNEQIEENVHEFPQPPECFLVTHQDNERYLGDDYSEHYCQLTPCDDRTHKVYKQIGNL